MLAVGVNPELFGAEACVRGRRPRLPLGVVRRDRRANERGSLAVRALCRGHQVYARLVPTKAPCWSITFAVRSSSGAHVGDLSALCVAGHRSKGDDIALPSVDARRFQRQRRDPTRDDFDRNARRCIAGACRERGTAWGQSSHHAVGIHPSHVRRSTDPSHALERALIARSRIDARVHPVTLAGREAHTGH